MSEQSIKRIVYLFRFINDTGIIPLSFLKKQGESFYSQFSQKNQSNILSISDLKYGITFPIRQKAFDIFKKNRDIVMFILMINFIHKMVAKLFRIQQLNVTNGKFKHTPKNKWNNDYPIILVHGYMGYTPDSCFFGNYFQHALQKNVLLRGSNYREDQENKDIYIALISPISGIHDRACELYQQLVGITHIRNKVQLSNDDFGPNLVKAIYGVEHFNQEHSHQSFYKPRHLRQIRGGDYSQQIFAFPDGLPGGWNSIRKAHFIAHSQGAQTVRYLQYLLSIDYFSYLDKLNFKVIPKIEFINQIHINSPIKNEKDEYQKVDKSDYIASITSLNGILNGSLGPYTLDVCTKTFKFQSYGRKNATWLSISYIYVMKMLIILQNIKSPYLTKERIQENIKKVIKIQEKQNKQTILQLGMQLNVGMFDLNAEFLGLNRKKLESLPEYIKRVLKDNIMSDTSCTGLDEMVPCKQSQYNSQFQTYKSTYYFSHSTGDRKKIREKFREVFKEPVNLSQDFLGYNFNITESLKYRNSIKKLKKRDNNNQITFYEWIFTHVKIVANLLSIIEKTYFENFSGLSLGLSHLDNRKNNNMNNLMQIDFAIRDWIDDTDYLVPRISQEFPRISQLYKSKHQKDEKNLINQKPWGNLRSPVYIEPFLDENQLRLSQGQNYEKGVWYYTGYPLTDHHDMAGVPSFYRDFHTILGLEFRPTFWINIYNRLRSLEFKEKNQQVQIHNCNIQNFNLKTYEKEIQAQEQEQMNHNISPDEDDYDEEDQLQLLGQEFNKLKNKIDIKQLIKGIKIQTSSLF